MIRYLYNRQTTPPAPFVYVTVACPKTGPATGLLPAQLDIGADRSVIPLDIARQLNLVQMDALPVGGFGTRVETLPTFAVSLAIREFPAVLLEIFGVRGEPFVLLGRDMLNRYRIVLDGPQLALEISEP
jgi:hypothetical protein